MSRKKKIILPVVLLFITALAGSFWLSGFIVLKMAGLPADQLRWDTFLTVWSVYGDNRAYQHYIFAGFAGMAAPFILALILSCAMLFKLKEKKGLHGNARLANDNDLAKSGFFPSGEQLNNMKYPAVLIGKMPSGRFKGRYLLYSGQQFLMLYAPTRSGKGVGIVIPNCIYYPESLVVLDIKLENFLYTAGYRKKILRQEVFLFCPDGYHTQTDGKQVLSTHRYNPLYYIRRDAVNRYGDLDKIGAILFPLTGGESDTWIESSKNVFMALVLFLLDTEEETTEAEEEEIINGEIKKVKKRVKKYKVNMTSVLKLSVPADGTMLGKWFTAEIKERNNINNLKQWENYKALPENEKEGKAPEKYPLSADTVRLFRQFSAKEPKQQESIMLTFNNVMAMFANPVCAAATEENDFDFRDIRRKRMSVYFGLSPDGLEAYSRLVNLFFSQLINENVRTLPDQDSTLKYQVLLMLDEFTSMGRVNIIQKAIAFTAGYNLRFVFILQNKGQLADEKKGYGREGAETFLENCAVELVYPPKKVNKQVEEVSETIGYKDEVLSSVSHTTGKQTSKTRSKQIHKRAVLLPQEIVELREIKHKSGISLPEIVLSETCRPFIAHKIIYFEEKFFTSRKKIALENVPVLPVLKISEDEIVRQLQLQRERAVAWGKNQADNADE